MNARKQAAGEQPSEVHEQVAEAIESLAGHPAAENDPAPRCYFWQQLESLSRGWSVAGGEWPLAGARMSGPELSRLDNALYALAGIVDLLQAESLACEAEDSAHVHAGGRLGGNIEDRLQCASRMLVAVAFDTVERVRERAEAGER